MGLIAIYGLIGLLVLLFDINYIRDQDRGAYECFGMVLLWPVFLVALLWWTISRLIFKRET